MTRTEVTVDDHETETEILIEMREDGAGETTEAETEDAAAQGAGAVTEGTLARAEEVVTGEAGPSKLKCQTGLFAMNRADACPILPHLNPNPK